MKPEIDLQHDIEGVVERAADAGLPFRKWPRTLRELWRKEQASRRKRELAFINMLGLLGCLICLPLDYSNGPAMLEMGLILRLGIVVPAYLVAIAAALKGGWELQRWTSILSAACFAGVAAYLGMHTDGPQRHEYIMGAALLTIIATVVIPLRPASLAAMVLLANAIIWAVWFLAPGPAPQTVLALLGYLSAISLLALAIPMRTMALKDRNFLYAVRGRLASQRLVAVNEQLRELSHRDDLTGLPNRRYFERIFHTAFQAATDSGDDLAVMMIDVDHFKQFNDTHGHTAGDRALKLVATQLEKQFTASGSTVARFGGEEFVVVVEGCTEEGAMSLADRARRAVAQRTVIVGLAERVAVSVSIGVALRRSAGRSPEALLESADKALYAAKNAGRDLVRLAGDGDNPAPPALLKKSA